MKYSRAFALAACLAAIPVAGMAVAGTPANNQAAKPPHPTRGMTMKQVRAKFGIPKKMLSPTPRTAQGPHKPPIVRWVYPRFIVYFERNYVIHTVITNPREAPIPHTANPPRG